MGIQIMQKIKYLDWLYKIDYNKEQFLNLDELLKKSINLADELFNEESYEILPLKKRKILERK